MSHKPSLSRRDFIKAATAFVVSLMGAGIGLPSLAYLLSPSLRKTEDNSIIDLGPLEKYPVGIPTRFDFTRTKVNGWERTSVQYGAYVFRTRYGGVRVFSDICTHLGCRITWQPGIQNYVSPCHDGHFGILGNVVGGPPPRPLDEFITKTENGNLFLTLPPFKRMHESRFE
jgi:menaquinol-cytochrome c reductase iron-sulfur subunit